jgi:hypothetical protein
MPQFGHGLVGLGLGAATIADPRTPALRDCWIGLTVLLAYLPDVLEWLAALAGLRLPHSAPASIPIGLLSILAVLGLLRFRFREPGRAALVVAACAVASHSLLDAVNGGIPLWWPIHGRPSGSDWLGLRELSPQRRTWEESRLFLPVLAVGVAVGIIRGGKHPLIAALAAGLGMWAVIFAILDQLAGVAVCLVLEGLLTAALVRELRWRWLLNLVPAVPVLALGAVQLYAWREMREGLAAHIEGRFTAAITHSEAAGRFRPVDMEAAALYRAATCYQALGDYERAHALYERGRAEFPGHLWFLDGLAELYVSARETRFWKPAEAERLALFVIERTADPAYRAYVERILQRARALQRSGVGE